MVSGALYAFAQGDAASGEGKITMSECSQCHGEIDQPAKWEEKFGLIFNHPVHLNRGYKCDFCHKAPVHEKNRTNRVSMDLCYDCHGLAHGKQGEMAPPECGVCHPPGFDLKPAYHKKEGFFPGEHVKKARENVTHCYTCHAQPFCADCHTARKAIPQDHKAANWGTTHGEIKGFELDNCNICHAYEFCAKCHKTPMPHSVFYISDHRPDAKKDDVDCMVCHREVFCSDCHHVENVAITMENCASCHSELKTGVYTSPSFIFTHEPHFKKNFACNECHKGKDATEVQEWPMHSCYSKKCHAMEKAPGTGKCEACHPKEFNLVPAKGSMYGDHTASNFLVRNHADLATKDINKCQICHLQSFCDKCHGMEIPHPADFKTGKHKTEARTMKTKCDYCHPDKTFCEDCHHKGYKVENGPFEGTGHPPLVREVGAQACFECHGPTYCAYCHVKGVAYKDIKGP